MYRLLKHRNSTLAVFEPFGSLPTILYRSYETIRRVVSEDAAFVEGKKKINALVVLLLLLLGQFGVRFRDE
jgi:hypothetical protein